ncbi:serine/threonine protein kinase (plasmid) [Bacillus methanolicus]|uniref:serine/threonine protein kinase n=1 Tax=Bacillus methanolicus TaxID=1471 RepID=UPI002380A3CA|nr:serine/threonine-protein kinase [Bacillus methanolicus]MDE3841126.1 serine/threonine protein kinase [Bacillus methanolicus]
MNMDRFAPESSAFALAFPGIEIIGVLGKGGQKYVYKAKTHDYGIVAFKIIKTDQDIERTIREIKAASSFSSPHFPMIYDWGEAYLDDEKIIYIIEEYIEGQNLREILNQEVLTMEETIRIGRELLEALSQLAEKRLVHRDIKPENIMISNDGRVFLLDLGIARHLDLTSLTLDMAAFGPLTPGYGAPEQIKNEKRTISSRTDLFSWGVVMYEMIAGYNPFVKGCKNGNEAMSKTLTYQPPKLQNCSSDLSEIIDWCLSKSAHRRPPSPAIVLEKMKEM